MRAKRKFKKILIIYSLSVLLVSFVFLIYIFLTLKSYENHQTGNYLKSTINSLSDDTLLGYLKENNKDDSLLDTYKKQVKSKDITFKKQDDNTFDATLNGRVLFTVKTKVVKELTKLAIFSYQEREVVSITPYLDRGLIYYDITIPSNFNIYLDNELKNLEATKKNEYKDLSFMYYDDVMPSLATYEINDLTEEKKVTVKDFLDKEVELKQKDYTYTSALKYYEAKTIDDAKKYINDLPNILEMSENWSKFLTKDLSGFYYGFTNIISPYLIEGTSLYQMAYNWSHSVDITFTSQHTLGNPPFTNEEIKNFVIYDENAFSCEVYLEKNMYVKGKREVELDIMHDYLYFIKYNGEWKLMNIKSVGEEHE